MSEAFPAPASAKIENDLGVLFDDPEFHALHRRMSPFNLFEAMGAVRGELASSDSTALTTQHRLNGHAADYST